VSSNAYTYIPSYQPSDSGPRKGGDPNPDPPSVWFRSLALTTHEGHGAIDEAERLRPYAIARFEELYPAWDPDSRLTLIQRGTYFPYTAEIEVTSTYWR
jgi:hypothetical protein